MGTLDRGFVRGWLRPTALGFAVALAGACSVDPGTSTSNGGNGDGGSGGGTGIGNVARDVSPGQPISAPDAQWTRVDIEGATCRNGNPAHIMVHLNSASKKVAIYEESGGACFNDASCTLLNVNPPTYLLGAGIFNFDNAENPIRDWNIFYIPYCTGDVHAGDNPSYDVGPVTGTVGFHGYANSRLYLERILATVPDATDWLLAGSSAGGFGAGLTADLFARNAPASVERFTLIDDSGPPMSSTYVPTCLQHAWRTAWGLDATILKDCGSACPNPDDFTTSWVLFLLEKYAKGPNANRFRGGLISATHDLVIRTFFGFGGNDCNPTILTPLKADDYAQGLADIRSVVMPRTSLFGTFYYDSVQHTTLVLNKGDGVLGGLYDTHAPDSSGNDVRLVDWVRDLVENRTTRHVGP